jgi:Tse2 ADP-ribosyltransferase toxins
MKNEKQKEDRFFIEKKELGELFDSKFSLNVNLYRGNNPNNNSSALYPILKSFLLSDGRIRKADIKTYLKNGVEWINSKYGGVSLFDVKGCPVRSWEYYLLAVGAKIPFGLVITKDDFNENFKCYHYSIRANWDMPVSKFCILLDELSKELKKV